MPALCYSVLRGKRIRVTALDECGAPNAALAANSLIVSKGFITVAFAPVYKDATEYEQVDADDELCVNEMGRKQLKRVELTLSFCNVDPELVALVTGNPVEVSGAGDSVGYRLSEDAPISNFAFELWSGIGNQACADGDVPYGYFLLPWVTDGTLNDHTIENGVTNFEITARTNHNSLWGQGPFNVAPDGAAGVPSELADPILPGEHYLQRYTTVAPPPAVCGLQAMPAAPTPAI